LPNIRVLPAGDQAAVLEFENRIDPDINSKVRAADYYLLHGSELEGLLETVPTYRSLLVYYDPGVWDFESLKSILLKIEEHLQEVAIPNPETLEIPVVYGGEYGPDIDYVAEHNNLSVEEVIEIHHSAAYLIYMLGFVPGFPYLGGMSQQIATPRLENPRTQIPAGSVGIAGSQTGIYPLESPGGWRLIGRTPLKLFDPAKDDPFLPKPGHYLKFYPISEQEFKSYR